MRHVDSRSVKVKLMYDLQFDAQNQLLKRKLWGFWDVQIAQNYITDLKAMIAKIKKTTNYFKTISDIRETETQSAGVVKALKESLKDISDDNNGPVAIICNSVIKKLQAEYIYPYSNVRVFLDEESALQWLSEQREPG